VREARTHAAGAVLVTDLDTGAQALWVEGQQRAGELAIPAWAHAEITAAVARDASRTVEQAGLRLFIGVYAPKRRLLVVGAVHIAQALVAMAAAIDLEVTLVDPRSAWATDERFPGVALDRRWPEPAFDEFAPDRRSAIVTLSHDPKLDEPALAAALRSDAFYIGALGSRRTHARRLERLKELGFEDSALARIHSPIGLDIGAVSPAEIAVAIVAEILQAARR
jgi:xanthine dehydrogenase accessory factor